jgi:ligand-binding sensor protein
MPGDQGQPQGTEFYLCHRPHEHRQYGCRQANLRRRNLPVSIEECDAGMLKLAVPIFVGEEFVGTVSGCGLLLDDGEVDTFLLGKITGMQEANLTELAAGIPAMSMENARAICRYIQAQVAQMVTAYQEKVS